MSRMIQSDRDLLDTEPAADETTAVDDDSTDFTVDEYERIVDDVVATGSTVEAAAGLVSASGASVVAVSVLMELGFLSGRNRLGGLDLRALLRV